MARLVTWNVRHGLGLDRRVSLDRVLRVLARLEPDVLAVQELDVGRARSGGVDQPRWLAERLAMQVVFAETCDGYGHALFSRLRICAHASLPLPSPPAREPRALIDATLELEHPERSSAQPARAHPRARVLATHLGLVPAERSAQARAIADRLGASAAPTMLLGDLNASPGQPGYEELVPALRDPLAGSPLRERCTWPALWPFRALDHALVSAAVWAHDAHIVGVGAARFASDHRPVLTDARLG